MVVGCWYSPCCQNICDVIKWFVGEKKRIQGKRNGPGGG